MARYDVAMAIGEFGGGAEQDNPNKLRLARDIEFRENASLMCLRGIETDRKLFGRLREPMSLRQEGGEVCLGMGEVEQRTERGARDHRIAFGVTDKDDGVNSHTIFIDPRLRKLADHEAQWLLARWPA